MILRFRRATLLLIFLFAAPIWVCQGQPSGSTRPLFRSDRLILVRPQADPARLQALRIVTGVRTVASYPRLGGVEVVQLPPGADLETTYARFVEALGPSAVSRDYLRWIGLTPNDPRYAQGLLWGLHNTGQNGGLNDADIDAPEAWDTRTDASAVVVAVIDSGVRLTHEDLVANLWVNPDEIPGNGLDDDGNGYVDDVHGINAITGSGNPTDDQGHGTHCAGTVGAVGNNNRGVVGVAWSVRIMALKFISAEGVGSDSDAIECIDYAMAKGAHIISASWGSSEFNPALQAAIESARTAGVLFVAGAGNEGSNNDQNPFYPASYPLANIVSVAATDRRDLLADFSNYGPSSVDIAAPGVAIISTGHESDTAYVTFSGTSMATPHVAGAVALLRAQYPAASMTELIARLYSTVDRLPSLAGRVGTGGRLNIGRAISAPDPRPSNDAFANSELLTGNAHSVSVYTALATAEPFEPNHAGSPAERSVWFSWTAAEDGATRVETDHSDHDTRVAVYTGGSLDQLTEIASNDDRIVQGRTIPQAGLVFQAVRGTTYRIALDSKGGGGIANLLLLQRAPNDDFRRRTPLSGQSFRVLSSNEGATREPGEPIVARRRGGASLWWEWTAPRSGSYLLTTDGDTTFDTVAGVFVGDAVDRLGRVADDDDSGPGTSSQFYFNASAGARYQITVDGAPRADGSAQTGLVELTVAPMFNDLQANALAIEPGENTQRAHNLLARREVTDPRVADAGGGATLWWTYSPTEDTLVTLGTQGSTFEAVLGVYTRTPRGTFQEVARANAFTSQATFVAKAGVVYWICVDGSGPPGNPSRGVVVLSSTTESLTAPRLVRNALDQTVSAGRDTSLFIVAEGAPPLTYAWSFNGTPIAGNPTAATPVLSLVDVTPSDQGEYTCVVSNASGSAVAGPAFLTVTPLSQPVGRLGNLSVRASAGTREGVLIAGFVVSSGEKRLLLRAVGPSLSQFGIDGALANPRLRLLRAGIELAANDDWQVGQDPGRVSTAASQIGAFPLLPGSRDAAVVTSLPPGAATVLVESGSSSGTGLALAEVYGSGRTVGFLRNLSARVEVGRGDSVAIGGFVILDHPLTVLVRGVGPGLATFGVPNVLPNPRIRLYTANHVIVESDDWGDAPDPLRLVRDSAAVGAFPLVEGSADAALVLTLPPGAYTVVMDAPDASSGIALLEVYALD